MKFTLSLTEDDYLDGLRAVTSERKVSYWCIEFAWVFGVLFLALGCIPAAMSYYADGTIDPAALLFGIPAWLFGLFYLLYSRVIRPRVIRVDYRNHPVLHGDQTWELDDGGLKHSADWGHSELLWKAVLRWRETPNQFLLFLGKRTFYIFPKRNFSPPQEAEFRALLLQKLPQK
jgi:hypothetical protein